jgi:hypothetical protein
MHKKTQSHASLESNFDADLPKPRAEVRSQDHSLPSLSQIGSFDSLLESLSNRSTGPFRSSPMQTTLGASSTFSQRPQHYDQGPNPKSLVEISRSCEFMSRGSQLLLSKFMIPEMPIRVYLLLCQCLPCAIVG